MSNDQKGKQPLHESLKDIKVFKPTEKRSLKDSKVFKPANKGKK